MTERNRLKRHARESFRRARATLPGRDFLVYFFSRAATATPKELRATLDAAFAQIR